MNKLADTLSPPDENKFGVFWSVYPRRKGSNPRAPAEAKFAAAVKNGADPLHIISSARKFAAELKEQNKLDTEFIPMARTWLHQRRWEDFAPTDDKERNEKLDAAMLERGYIWRDERWTKV